jgi:hypothetical protein
MGTILTWAFGSTLALLGPAQNAQAQPLAGNGKFIIQYHEGLALSPDPKDPNGQLILATLNPADPKQRWSMTGGNDTGQPTRFINEESGKALGYPKLGHGARGAMYARSDTDERTAWTLSRNTGNVNVNVLTRANTSSCLMPLGNPPFRDGSAVGIYGVTGRTWDIHPESAFKLESLVGQPKVIIRSRVKEMALSLNPKDPDGNLVLVTLNRSDPKQRWYMLGNQKAARFINEASGKAMGVSNPGGTASNPGGFSKPGKGLKLSTFVRYPTDERITWDVSGNLNNCAIRPQQNTDMNLNVLGSGPYVDGSAVGLWVWGRGQGNETWELRIQ